jgi:hypothetical protein
VADRAYHSAAAHDLAELLDLLRAVSRKADDFVSAHGMACRCHFCRHLLTCQTENLFPDVASAGNLCDLLSMSISTTVELPPVGGDE